MPFLLDKSLSTHQCNEDIFQFRFPDIKGVCLKCLQCVLNLSDSRFGACLFNEHP